MNTSKVRKLPSFVRKCTAKTDFGTGGSYEYKIETKECKDRCRINIHVVLQRSWCFLDGSQKVLMNDAPGFPCLAVIHKETDAYVVRQRTQKNEQMPHHVVIFEALFGIDQRTDCV